VISFYDVINYSKRADSRSIFSLFSDTSRADDFVVETSGIFCDYSKQNITKKELDLLFDWAKTSGLAKHIHRMFSGEKINVTEERSVLHTVLRSNDAVKRKILKDEAQEVIDTEAKMAKIVTDVCTGELLSASGEKFTDVLAIGIGGSYYGVKVGLSALKPYHSTGLNVHVLANVDGVAVEEKINLLPANTTLVVVISKTFTTQETLLNANAIKNWMLRESFHCDVINKQWTDPHFNTFRVLMNQ